jgi:hypothetical protein
MTGTAYRILVGKPEGSVSLGMSRRILDNNIKIHLRDGKCRTLANTVMDLRNAWNVVEFFCSFSRRAQFVEAVTLNICDVIR